MENVKAHLLNIDKITTDIDNLITQAADHSDPDAIALRIVELSAMLGTSTEATANAERIYNSELGKLAEQYKDSKISATDKKMIFTGKLAQENYYKTLTDRQNKAITHTIEGLRSVISYLKQEKQQSAYQA